VVKNTLALRALADTPLEGMKAEFDGPIAIAITFGDPIAAAKVAVKSAKDHNKLVLKKGFSDGAVFESIETMSSMPTKDEIRAQIIGLMTAAPQKFLGVLNAVPQKLLGVFLAREDQLKEQGEPK